MRGLIGRCALLAVAVVTLLVPAVARAQTSLELGVKYLEAKEKAEKTEEPAFGGDWALTSLASAEKAAVEVTRGKTNARAWYETLIDPATWPEESEYKAGDYEKAALVAYAAGLEPARVSVERNLIANIISEYQTEHPGYYGKPSVFEDTIFGVLGLADTKTMAGLERIPSALLKQSVEVIEKNQHTDGGWNYEQAEGSKEITESIAETDTTGAALAALCTSGVENETEKTSVAKGEEFLKKSLETNGGFEYIYGKPNTDSSAWAVQGLKACKVNLEKYTNGEKEAKTPIQFLEANQIKAKGAEEGGFPEEKGGTANYYASQDGVRALARGGFTAEPPTPKNKELKQWEYKTKFSTTKSSLLALIINNGSSLKVCSVTVKASSEAEESSISLVKILEKAVAGGKEVKPSGCVTGFEPKSGGAITSINGTAASWKVILSGGGEATAELGTKVELGAVIFLDA